MLQDQHGNWIGDRDQLQALVRNFFFDIYTDDNPPCEPFLLPTNHYPSLSIAELDKLARGFMRCEIKKALFDMHPYKAPGPNGFQAFFYQKYWDLTGNKLTHVALEVLDGKPLPRDLNDTFLVLIPKIENLHFVSQLRPIGLCNVAYKVITKAIVNRLKPILNKVIAPTQTSFVPNRKITDNAVIVQEMLHSMRRKKGSKGTMAIKINLERAYDRLRWQFIRESLTDLGLLSN